MDCQQIDKISQKNWLTDQQKAELISLIASSFKGVDSAAYFARYFMDPSHYQQCVRLFYQQNQLVGYCLLTFKKDKACIVMGASAAFLPSFRGNNNTFGFSLKWAVKTWLFNLRRSVYYLDTMLSPAMYRAMGKKVAFIYPNPSMTEAEIADYQALVVAAEPSPWRGLPCLKSVGRASNYSESDLIALKTSSKPEIAFYCHINPNFALGSALLVLIPINLKQLLATLWKAVKFGR